ncbi:MAG: cytochrome c [Xanthomonadales bacterium]|nr:cytochrome c [Xanthomonadales bacterium]
MKNKYIFITILSFIAVSSINTAIAGDAAAGKEKSAMCAACHGADGNGTDPQYPRLAGQHQDYLAKSLHDYKSGDRKNPTMNSMVVGLTDDDIENLAAFYASLDGLKDLSAFK